MSSSPSVFESAEARGEYYLLDNLPLEDRKKDIRQLVKLLNLSKTGQAKSLLITGDPGIGKTALVDTFCDLIRRGIYCRIVDLRGIALESPGQLYVAFIEAFQREAEAILDEALEAVNEINAELGIEWERQDLVRSIALVKLQESIGGKDAISQERLAKAIKSSIPTVKKLRFSTVNESIERLVNILVNPWLLVATNLINPLIPQLQDAIRLAQTLKQSEYTRFVQQPAGTAEDVEVDPQAVSSSSLSATSAGGRVNGTGHAGVVAENVQIIDVAALREEHVAGETLTVMPAYEEGVSSEEQAALPAVVSDFEDYEPSSYDGTLDTLNRHLTAIFSFVNDAIGQLDSGLFVVLDEWESVLALPELQRNEMKDFMAHLLRETTDRKHFHLMIALCCRSEGESESLGGSMYSLFRNKLLLTGINERSRRKFFLKPFKNEGIQVSDRVLEEVFRLTQGNPFWLLKFRHFLKERAESNQLKSVDLEFYRKLGIERLDDLMESSFTRIKLAFINEEDNLYKVIAALLKQQGSQAFSVSETIRELSISQNVSELFVAEVLRHLFIHDFLAESDSPEKTEPAYRIQSRLAFRFLQEKTQAIQADVSTSEKMAYLRKIIPLSVKSGELDREKTREVIALSTTIGNADMVQFLEDTFIEYLQDENAMVRITALNNIAILDSERSLKAVLIAMKDPDSMVREYAARNLAVLSRKPRDPQCHDEILNVLIDAIDDESEGVRAQVYSTLARYKWSRDLLSVFLKGMADASESVRITAIQNLVEIADDSPLVKASYLDASDDDSPVVRRFACLGMQQFRDEDCIEVLTRMLREDPETQIRAIAADALSSMENDKALDTLLDALSADADEDVKLTVIRALGKRRGWKTEEALLTLIEQQPDVEYKAPALLWGTVRSLGHVAGTERTLELLRDLKERVSSEIIRLAIDVALRRINERIEELRQLERQLQSATPVAVLESSTSDEEEEDEVPVLEDERI